MSLTVQLYTMLSMIGMGAWIGAALDTYQRFLKRTQRKRWVVFIHDILFWIVQALFVFYVLLLVNEAELRVYVFVALLCGFAAYQSLLKSLYMKMLNVLIYVFVQAIRFFIRIIQLLMIKPVIIIAQLVIAFILFLFRIMLSIGHVLWKCLIWILLFVWKVFFWPVRFIALLIWKLLPNRVTLFIKRHAGFLQRAKKLKEHIFQFWERIKKKLGGPRK
ncbi:spore cortex biosynthesis protein YabQ [Bacillus pseudomycoides]|uniref:Spore cortex biosynthesis protein YabQ n=1 Tax=Bacillus pseudomycoides TaxID=64104 RepID=A0AA91VCA2_9BACI|nr:MULTISPECIES: spore cortex biosynthesis protein YabQ [Bacillus]PEB51989.1 spore cortex biosynthesis protein YabQ [Bacillus sp. AFS098217]PED82364.1 spore cortex biosynthesis protein YabQ [Bacillus pseudomycoides]PEU15448.1 spore cortex biosynthesis protein YabQ [Bacillus sp. AFS019443]PEU20443.1 spore cortex biosynthesis protein YabQ [Bacillus sp. AFS014408]PFW60979.1 spore cortex biosynthesis protein YabQ [Bacillus sp. AFS075034]